jgi:hypothetical protein
MPNPSPPDYQYWRHKALRERYAVRLQGTRVTGFKCLRADDLLNPVDLPDYDYNTSREGCRQLEERGGEFVIVAETDAGGRRLPSALIGHALTALRKSSRPLLRRNPDEDDPLSHV